MRRLLVILIVLLVNNQASHQEVVLEYDDLDYHVAPVMKLTTKDGKTRTTSASESSSLNDCFCKLTGDVDDCNCKIDYIDKFNNYQVQPRLRGLVQHSYFRYIKINLKKICQFWHDDARCSLKDCHVTTCSEEDLPDHFKKYLTNNGASSSSSSESKKINNKPSDKEDSKTENCEQSNPLGQLNNTLTDDDLRNFEEWNKYDASQDNFCEPDDKDEFSKNAQYMDLVANPERYTGYKGPHAHKIWRSIYQENCFDNPNLPTTMSPYYATATSPEHQTCLEKRVFHRLISGLHASINIHLSAEYLHKSMVLGQPDRWGPNVAEFKRRFDPETTQGMGPQWLKNLYFVYLVELRAIHKAAPYLSKEAFFATGDPQLDQEVKAAVLDLVNVTSTFRSHFDESVLFRGDPIEARQLKDQFQHKFRNITKIMNCVGCDKCKLWGKVQTLGLGTALKILFSGKTVGPESRVDKDLKNTFQLSRSEIVALFNGFARLSTSISHVEMFREVLNKESGSSSFLKPPSSNSASTNRHQQREL